MTLSKISECSSETDSFFQTVLKTNKNRVIDRSLLTRKQHEQLLSIPRPIPKPEPPPKRKVKRCKIPQICPERIDQLSIPKSIYVIDVLQKFNNTLHPDRVVRLVKLVHAEKEEEAKPRCSRKKPKRKRRKAKRKKQTVEQCIRIWLKKRIQLTTKLIVKHIKAQDQKLTPNYRQLLIALGIMRSLKIKKKRMTMKYTKKYLMNICEQLAIECDNECKPYGYEVAPIEVEPEEEDTGRKHIVWIMKEPPSEEESETEEVEEEEEEEEELVVELVEEEEEEEEEVAEEAEGEEAEGEEAEGEEAELEEELEEETGGVIEEVEKTIKEEPEVEEEEEVVEEEEGKAILEAIKDEYEHLLEDAESAGVLGDILKELAEGEKESEGEEEEEEVQEEEEEEEPPGEVTLPSEAYEPEEMEVPISEMGEEFEMAPEEFVPGEEMLALEEGVEEVEEEEEAVTAVEEPTKEPEVVEKKPSEEIVTVEPEMEIVPDHPPNTVSYLAWTVYSSWLEEFGNNMNTYGKCLRNFREILESKVVSYSDTAKIESILTNWGTYLRDSLDFERQITETFKGKPISKCVKCGEYTLYNIPPDHEIPPELKKAAESTARWRQLLTEAEKLCRSFQVADDVSILSHETIEIDNIESLESSGPSEYSLEILSLEEVPPEPQEPQDTKKAKAKDAKKGKGKGKPPKGKGKPKGKK